jgi:hypothetical protein
MPLILPGMKRRLLQPLLHGQLQLLQLVEASLDTPPSMANVTPDTFVLRELLRRTLLTLQLMVVMNALRVTTALLEL